MNYQHALEVATLGAKRELCREHSLGEGIRLEHDAETLTCETCFVPACCPVLDYAVYVTLEPREDGES